MTLTEFNPKLLNFLHELTKLNGLKSSAKIADEITLENGEKVTPKTVRNWFEYLNQPYKYLNYNLERKFSYYPVYSTSKLGLNNIGVIYENPSPKVINLFPFQDYLAWLYNPATGKNDLMIVYIIDPKKIPDFQSLLEKIKKDGLFTKASFFQIKNLLRTESPYHKILDKNGIFHPEKNDFEKMEYQIRKIQNEIPKLPKIEMIDTIRNNLFIVPVLMEYTHENWTSTKVWNAIKDKLGEDVWNYIKKGKRKTDGVGISRVQKVLLNMSKYSLFKHMRVVYMPMEIKHNFFVYLFVKSNGLNDLIDCVQDIAMNSIFQNIYINDSNSALIIALVNNESLQRLFNKMDSVEIEKMYFLNYKKSGELITTSKYNKFDYSKVLDVENQKWNFDYYMNLPNWK